MIKTLKKQVKWRKDKKELFICDCKRLIDLKLSFEHESFLKRLSMGLNPGELVAKESLIFSEFEKMNLLDDLKINQLLKEDFYLAMNLLDNELGKNRARDSNFLEVKFKENAEFFIGIYLGKELIGAVCGFPREDYLLMSEIAIDSRFQRRKFGEKLVKKFEKVAFKKYNKIHVGALDNAIEFYKSLNYKPFLLVQFENGVYDKNDFSSFEVLSVLDYGIELNPINCNLIELKRLRNLYPKAKLQYIFTKRK